MGVILEIASGPLARKSLSISSGQSLLVGRDAKRGAQFAVPHDGPMSGVHFAVECGANGCRVIDKKSTNGTFLNGARIQEAMLASGDEIKAGQTTFVVRIVPDDQLSVASSLLPAASGPAVVSKEFPAPIPSPVAGGSGSLHSPVAGGAAPAPQLPPIVTPAPGPASERSYRTPDELPPSSAGQAAYEPKRIPPPPVTKPPQPASPSSRPGQPPTLSVGRWLFAMIPEGWKIQDGLGIQLDVKDEKVFSSNIGAMEEPIGPGITLSEYVEAQTKMFREYLREPRIDAALPPKISGAAETIALDVRFSTTDGPSIYYRRLYVRGGSAIGVLTLTTLEKDLPAVRSAYDSFVAGASFSPKT